MKEYHFIRSYSNLIATCFFCLLFLGATAQYSPIEPKLELKVNSKVYFASSKYELSKTALKTLNDLLLDYDDNQVAEFRIQAFTDDVGSAKENELLAQQRAASVQEYLIEQGISTPLIKLKASEQLRLNPDQTGEGLPHELSCPGQRA